MTGKKIKIGDYIKTNLDNKYHKIDFLFVLDSPNDYSGDMQSVKYVTPKQIEDGYVCLEYENHWVKSRQIDINSHSEIKPSDDIYGEEVMDKNKTSLKGILNSLLLEEFPPWTNDQVKKYKTLPAQLKSKISGEIHNLIHQKYFDTIPLDDMFDILEKYGIVPLQEDNTQFSGFLTGRKGTAMIEMGYERSVDPYAPPPLQYIPFQNAALRIEWYKLENTNKYEVVAYIS